MTTDQIAERFRTIQWRYADKDPSALDELRQRVAITGRKRGLITYSDFVQGVTFNLPNLRGGPRAIDIGDWSDLDRAIAGDFLGFLSMQSYEQAGFFSSALV